MRTQVDDPIPLLIHGVLSSINNLMLPAMAHSFCYSFIHSFDSSNRHIYTILSLGSSSICNFITTSWTHHLHQPYPNSALEHPPASPPHPPARLPAGYATAAAKRSTSAKPRTMRRLKLGMKSLDVAVLVIMLSRLWDTLITDWWVVRGVSQSGCRCGYYQISTTRSYGYDSGVGVDWRDVVCIVLRRGSRGLPCLDCNWFWRDIIIIRTAIMLFCFVFVCFACCVLWMRHEEFPLPI